MTVVFAGGGTGGHLYPAIAIADALRRRDATIAFVGSAERFETKIVPGAGYALYTVASHPLPRRLSFDLLRAVARNVKGTFQSLRLLRAQRPDLVIATGGYVCFPVALAARIRRLIRQSAAPIVLLEPNVTPGVTARLLAPIVDEIWGTCGGGRSLRAKCQPTGVPVRYRARDLPSKESALARLGLDQHKQTLVAMGGSQGARTINDALLGVLRSDAVPRGWQVLHVTGEQEYDRVRTAVEAAKESAPASSFVVRPYLEEMGDAYAAADLLLCRAGASTLGELAALTKPSILVPYPFAAQAHQAANAARFEAAGAAVVITDRELQSGALPALLAQTTAPERLAQLTSGARELEDGDPLDRILARVDILLSRKSEP